jgi:hypothetical protein
MRRRNNLHEGLTPFLAATSVVPVHPPKNKVVTHPSLQTALRVLHAVTQARGFHPERSFQSHPTIGMDARKSFYDPNPVDRWHPEFRDEILQKRLGMGENYDTTASRAWYICQRIKEATGDYDSFGYSTSTAEAKQNSRRNRRNRGAQNPKAGTEQEGTAGAGVPQEDPTAIAGVDSTDLQPNQQVPQAAQDQETSPEDPADQPIAPPVGGDPRRDPTTLMWLPPEGTEPPQPVPKDPQKDPMSKANKLVQQLQKKEAPAIQTAKEKVTSRYSIDDDPFRQSPRYLKGLRVRELRKGNRQSKPRQYGGDRAHGPVHKYWG